MRHPLLDPRRLAMLHALGLSQVWVPRAALDEALLARLLPRLPGPAGPGAATEARAQAAPGQRATAPAHRVPPAVRPQPEAAVCAPVGPRPQQIAVLDWGALQSFTDGCRACKLGATRQHAVFGIGSPRARLMIVGEAPGAEEDRTGEPFVGAAGRLLDNMLRACGLRRDGDDPAHSVYIANVIKCRPPGNRNPEADEIDQCLPILQRQIELLQPRLLLALGRFAAQALTASSEPIGRLRQRDWQWRGTPLVVSYHPAYLLRSPQDKAKAWADLCRAMDLLESAPASAGAS